MQSSETELVAILRLEDAAHFEFSLESMAGPVSLRKEAVVAIVAWTTAKSPIRRVSSVKNVRRGMSTWLRWVQQWNEQAPDDLIRSFADVSPFHVVRLRDDLVEKYSLTVAYDYFSTFANLVRHSQEARLSVRKEASKRRQYKKPTTQVIRYGNEEFRQIKTAARRIVESAHSRIRAAHIEALGYIPSNDQLDVRAKALHELLLSGRPTDSVGMRELDLPHLGPVGHLGRARQLLFMSNDEVFAAAVLLACQRGINLSPLISSETPHFHDAGIVQLDLDKPRRGPRGRFWPEILDDSDPDDRAASVVKMIAEATEPAREYLEANGHPTSTLLLHWSAYSDQPLKGLHFRRNAAWVPEGIEIRFARLRRSVPGRGVAKAPTDHDPTAYLHYVRTDPISLAEQQVIAAEGAQDALILARQKVKQNLLPNERSDPDNDALIVTCADPEHHPVTLTPCTSGYFSFLDCLECENAATASRLLPRQLAAVKVLESLRDVLGPAWQARFAHRYYMLCSIIDRHTMAERQLAAAQMADHIPIILSAMKSEIPR